MSSRDAAELRRAVRRLSLQFTALMVVVLALMAIVLYSVVATSTSGSINRTLADATRVDSPRDAAPGVFIARSGHDETRLSSPEPPGLPYRDAMSRVSATGTLQRDTISVDGRNYRVLTLRRGDHVIQAAVDTHESSEALHRLAWGMVISCAVALLLAAALSVWMAQRAMRPLAASLEQQRRFVADASHELRTPLTLLSTRAQMLRRDLDGEGLPAGETAGEVSRIVEDSKLLQEILDDLLISSDPRSVEDYIAVDLCGVASNAVELALPGATQSGLRLELELPTPPVLVKGSPVALLRVFTSLISNAQDHAQALITVRIQIHGADACLIVSDDGSGFAAGSKATAFERFVSARSVAETSSTARHYGLGLALVGEIAALHGGKVEIQDVPQGAGASVKVLLPLARS